ncbi:MULTISPECIES: NAD(P)/FAD-dependent oxidoreductase [Sphingobacterium]|uniref:NADH:ubiquinone reductase (non-electrogenic) n=1 Tax=Sphingobacterium cellulitidis TaxID=1768011 RepID=A0A8H9G2J9_9SPHI|nr:MULTISPECIES: NAD(P)/FAD-dependent oxidoreductase [Sphingobacterium]MBA8988563.1 NADH dehydrogenase [Sphingobacterium soli]OYD47469.1 FAD-dependent oxidoreductase [Sphingobacterium cellulitidis]WFB62584.1 NAD(P)/FAD-dependent oxidoreductase [Sphingobacterium sp. WM]GGE33811.1 NADH dehydrogenase [Sphingobacterium soli]
MLLNRSERNFPRVIIIGAGFGGVELARQLKNKEVEVLLIDRNNYHTFQPLMYQVATGTLASDSISFPLRKMFKNQKNFRFRLAEVLSIDSKNKMVHTSVADYDYDYLVIATGATSNFFGNKQVEKYALPMKNIIEALNIRSYLLQNLEEAVLRKNASDRERYLNFVVVGGGPTGVELSGAIAEYQQHMLKKDYPELSTYEMKVYLVEGTGKILGALSEKSSRDAERYLHELGVKTILDTVVTDYDGNTVTLSSGEKIPTKTVIWGAGVMGQMPEGINPEIIQRGNRIKTNEQCVVEGEEDVYAIGDVSAMITDENPRGLPGVAPVAQQQGKYVAKHIMNKLNKQETENFKYFDKGSMATVGRNRAVVDMGSLHLKGFIAWMTWMFVHLVSIFGFRNRLVTFVNWSIKFLTKNSGIRLIIQKYNRPESEPIVKEEEVKQA